MNKVLQINLGGYPFTIDEDAYKQLDTYIKEIRQHFAGTEGYEEITTDIEARLAELFQERLTNRPIVSLKDVEDVITRMGRPEEFGTDSMTDDDTTQSTSNAKTSYKTGKRLFRNTDEQIIAGVCSGIAAYFGISDPIWVRLAFVLIALSGGFGVPIYLILWAIVPKAESASDRLAMRGEPINVSNIGKIVKEEIEHISKKVSEFSEEMSDKTKKKKFAQDLDTKLDFRIHQAVDGLGDFLGKVAKTLSAVWKPILFIVAIILILLMLAAWISAVFAAFVSPPVVHYFFPEHTGIASLGFISLMFVIGIPLLTTALGIFRLVFGTRISSSWRIALGVFWVLNIGYLFFLGSAGLSQFAEKATVENRLTLDGLNSDTLKLEFTNVPLSDEETAFRWLNDGDFRLPPADARIYIRKSDSDQFYIEQTNSAHGQNYDEAERLAANIPVPYALRGNTIEMNNWVSIGRDNKWRVQDVRLTVYVPEGKYLHTNRMRSGHVQISAYYENRDADMWSFSDNLWQMKGDGLICSDCFQEEEQKVDERVGATVTESAEETSVSSN
jgi:phage shock protein PspC (stress-responsive transcriptional regulator)/predicted DNA binding CopG/RHH family protein